MDSIWKQDVQIPEFPELKGDLKTDVLVIGGGLAGLLCAWNLTKAGVDCTLIDAHRVMHGVSGRTTAKVTSQHGMIYGKLIHSLGEEKAKLYWQANEDGMSAIRKIAECAACDFQNEDSFLFQTDGTDKLEKEMAAYERLKIPATWEKSVPLPFPVAGALKFSNQAKSHPLKFASNICSGIKIYENTKARSFSGNRVTTNHGVISAQKIVIATHFPMLNKHGAYFLKLYQQRSYVVALESEEAINGMYLDCAENGLSVRRNGKWLLLGGGGHRTGKTGAGWNLAESIAQQYYPQAPIAAKWATQDCMTLDGMPYIGQYSKATPDLYVTTGFQKWGMTTSMTSAMILTDLIQGEENPYTALFSPSRSILHRQLLYNGVESTINLLRPSKPRCPHMGCALQWNPLEHSWDCPCHGSRFDRNGKLLNNPAADDI